MAEQAGKPRLKPRVAGMETTVPEEKGSVGPEADARGDALSAEQPGHYEMKRELARGGQAVILVAHDRHMGRDVAFKQLLPGGPRDAEERFLREARVAGQLEHPGVVPVYELGRAAGRFPRRSRKPGAARASSCSPTSSSSARPSRTRTGAA